MSRDDKVYIYGHGDINLDDGNIYICNEYEKESFDISNMNEIHILGEANIDKKFIEKISELGLTSHFYNYYEYYTGTYYPKQHYNRVELLIKQTEHYIDNNKRIVIARLLVEGAIKNMLQIIQYYNRRGIDLTWEKEGIKDLLKISKQCQTISELMGIEGNVRNYYYQSFDKIIKDDDFKFEQRTRRPPKNYLNTLISFGNSLLYTETLKQIYYTGLDPRIGFLHTSNYRRFSLNLDIAEIFKPILVDRVIFTLVNRDMINEKDFEPKSEGILLKERGRDIFLTQFDERLNTLIKDEEYNGYISYKELIYEEIIKLENHVEGREIYKPYISKW